MYQYRSFEVSSIIQLDSTGISHKRSSSTTIRNHYFVFQKDSLFGYNYNEHAIGVDDKPIRVDSVLKTITLQSYRLEEETLHLVPKQVQWNMDSSELIETYLFPASNEMPAYKRTLYYNKALNIIPESFSQKVDSVKKIKLVKVEALSDAFYDSKNNRHYPPSLVFMEMKVYDSFNKKLILSYFNLYKKSVDVKSR